MLAVGVATLLATAIGVACGDDDNEQDTRQSDTGAVDTDTEEETLEPEVDGTPDVPVARAFRIAVGADYPPYDVGTLSGLDYDLLSAVCDANPELECEIVDAPYSDCFTSDDDGNAVVAPALASGDLDGCMGWFVTQTRLDLGVQFSRDLSAGLPVSLIARADAAPPEGTHLGGAVVGVLGGFFNDAACLSRHYSGLTVQTFDGPTQREDMLVALADDTIDYAFWDSAAPIDPPAGTQHVGLPIGDCPDAGLALAAFGDNAGALVEAFDVGLAAIQADRSFDALCEGSDGKYGFGDPNCIYSYRIALGADFPPYDAGVLTGLNHDVLAAACDANVRMHCDIIDAPYNDCFDSDEEGNAILGNGLTSGTYDACMGWFITQARLDLGLTFSRDLFVGLPTALLTRADGLAPSSSDLAGARVGIIGGFFNDAACLSKHYSNFDAQVFGGPTAGDDLLAALASGDLDYVFWDTSEPIEAPEGTKYVAEPIADCPAKGIALAAYGDHATQLTEAFDAGLAAIQGDGTFRALCDASDDTYGFGDPGCIHSYRFALGSDFPPYDVGPLEGLNHDILTAACAANVGIHCDIVPAPYGECFDTGAEGELIVGAGLATGTYDACVGWFITQARLDLGITFSDDYAAGLPAQLIGPEASPPLEGDDLGGATVGVLSGFFNDADCLLKHYTNFTPQVFSGETQRDDMLMALANGGIDYAFWDTAPPIEPPVGTTYFGMAIGDCPDAGLALACYGGDAPAAAAGFDRGLELIRQDGTLEQLCAESNDKYGLGDPGCLLE